MAERKRLRRKEEDRQELRRTKQQPEALMTRVTRVKDRRTKQRERMMMVRRVKERGTRRVEQEHQARKQQE